MAAGAPAIMPEIHAAGRKREGRAKDMDFHILIKVLLKIKTLFFTVPFHPFQGGVSSR